MTEQEYRKHPALNQSLLGSMSKGLEAMRAYLKLDLNEREIYVHQNKIHFRKGSALDILITGGEQAFKDSILITNNNLNPENQEYVLVQEYLKIPDAKFDIDAMEEFSRTVEWYDTKSKSDKVGLWASIKDPVKRKAKIDTQMVKEIWAYLKVYKDKVVISNDDYTLIRQAERQLKTSINTKHLFEEVEGVEVKYQYPLIYTIEGIEYKGLLDQLIIDHNTKTIKPKDLKSKEAETTSFGKSYLAFRYIYQDALYSDLVEAFRNEHYPEYTIEPFEFVVVNWNPAEEPIIFRASDELRNVGRNGGTINGIPFKGYKEVAKRYLDQKATGQWYVTPEEQKSLSEKGYLTIGEDWKVTAKVKDVAPTGLFDDMSLDDLIMADV